MNDWWYVLIFAVIYGYPRLVAHELSHAVAAICTGGSVDWKRFAPWPHRVDNPKRWVWGRMFRTGGDEMWIHLAPAGRASAFMLTWTALAAWLYWPLAVFAVWELTDVAHWIRGWLQWESRPYTDGAKARALLRD